METLPAREMGKYQLESLVTCDPLGWKNLKTRSVYVKVSRKKTKEDSMSYLENTKETRENTGNCFML